MKRKDLAKGIAAKLLRIRQSLHYSTSNMAYKIGITRGTYKRNENSETLPDTFALYKMARSLNISLDWLIVNKGTMFYPGKKPAKDSPSPRPLKDDVTKLLDHMERIPLLHHEVMTLFHKFKAEHKDMVAEAMSDKE
jgi:transcriptional regulator with XRE-family HTH domain